MRKSKKRQVSFDTCRFWSLNYTRLRTKEVIEQAQNIAMNYICLLYTSPSPRD